MNFPDALKREARHPRFYVLLTVGFACLLTATIWEAIYLKEFSKDPDIFLSSAWYENPKTWIGITKEIGFACFIAWIIAFTIELASVTRQEAAAEKIQNKLAKDVFTGIFENQLPKDVVQAIVNDFLNAPIIREKIDLTYILSDGTEYIEDQQKNFVQFGVTIKYRLRNITNKMIAVPIRLGIPLPDERRLAHLTKVNSVSVNGVLITDEEVEAGKKMSSTIPDAVEYVWTYDIDREGTIDVVISYSLAKEHSDNEVCNQSADHT